MTAEKSTLLKFVLSSLFVQILVGIVAVIWIQASLSTKIEAHEYEIHVVRTDLNKKADLEMVLRIKSDNDKRQDQILNDLQYIRQRIDYLTDKKQH